MPTGTIDWITIVTGATGLITAIAALVTAITTRKSVKASEESVSLSAASVRASTQALRGQLAITLRDQYSSTEMRRAMATLKEWCDSKPGFENIYEDLLKKRETKHISDAESKDLEVADAARRLISHWCHKIRILHELKVVDDEFVRTVVEGTFGDFCERYLRRLEEKHPKYGLGRAQSTFALLSQVIGNKPAPSKEEGGAS